MISGWRRPGENPDDQRSRDDPLGIATVASGASVLVEMSSRGEEESGAEDRRSSGRSDGTGGTNGLLRRLEDDRRNMAGWRSARAAQSPEQRWAAGRRAALCDLVIDLVASAAFWFVMFADVAEEWVVGLFRVLPVLLVLWRCRRWLYSSSDGFAEATSVMAELPYTCGVVRDGDMTLFVVATLHISPRSPLDARNAVHLTQPDLVMIELDEERLGPRTPPGAGDPEEPRGPREDDLQPITFTRPGGDPTTSRAQRAVWNAEWAGGVVRGRVVFDPRNEFGLLPPAPGGPWEGHLALMRRGAASAGEFASFAYKAHLAGQAGALAVLVIDSQPELPIVRLSQGSTLCNELELAWRTGRCGFPSLPVLLLPKEDGEMLRAACTESPTLGEFCVLDDSFPRRTLRRRLCQGCALFSSGIGIQYGIIDFFRVDIGGEFEAAVDAALARDIPSECIDVDMNAFWRRIGLAILPTPLNISRAVRAWLAFPRVFFHILFPPMVNIDTLGCLVLHAKAFTLRIWIAFFLGGLCASLMTFTLLRFFSWGGAQAVEMSGAVDEGDRESTEEYILIGIKMYILPRLFYAIAASRDLTMYENIKAQARTHGAKCLVAVMGAAHANGVLHLARRHGL